MANPGHPYSRHPGLVGYIEKREIYTPLPHEPWLSAPYDEFDIGSIKALANGHATEHQQKRAWEWILFATGYHENSYRSAEHAHDTAFACGRKWVGDQMVKLLRTTSTTMKQGTTG